MWVFIITEQMITFWEGSRPEPDFGSGSVSIMDLTQKIMDRFHEFFVLEELGPRNKCYGFWRDPELIWTLILDLANLTRNEPRSCYVSITWVLTITVIFDRVLFFLGSFRLVMDVCFFSNCYMFYPYFPPDFILAKHQKTVFAVMGYGWILPQEKLGSFA